MTTGATGSGTSTYCVTTTGSRGFPRQSSIVIPAFFAFLVLSRILQDATVCGPEKDRANSRSSQPWSTLPAPKDPPIMPACTAPPAPLMHGALGNMGGLIAEAAIFVSVELLLEPFPPAVCVCPCCWP